MRNVIWIVLTCLLGGVSSFKAGSGRARSMNTPMTPRREHSLSLFKRDNGCMLNRLTESVNSIANTINKTVPGGIATAITVPLVTAAAAVTIKSYFAPAKTKATTTTLNRYQCSGCGFTIFPAKNREERFFSSVSTTKRQT
ncbi:hypothetical protein protein [Babesia ovis]|uniref:Uncharacterized protein n=1 Tax=Babesia ovis TaxID=5869 RepID=A0A9W5TDS2_BABOV|nr:hypothetical protein protein [Babesia ovis]